MDFTVYQDVLTFFQNNVFAAIAAVVVVGLLVYKKPKLFFLLLLLVCVILGVMYVINTVSDIGTGHKKSMIEKERGIEPHY